ncbi:unnamed protein product [Heligmosomoides polygyrus]|uniref:Uncharacterized protein n=1 Tax=Heligmosomoides polygyrus TaxID=6339 RepID=A0A3P8EZG4_HELPZ|nr:unnamed protein product [Heligmosomoides polygyrus]
MRLVPYAEVNNFVQQLAEKEGTLVLLGLRCSDSIASHCLWDDGQGAASPYDAFFAGYPSVIGSCVLMMIGGPADGKWISGDCTPLRFLIITLKSRFTEYNGECYKAFDALPLTAAESVCVQNCGHVASVHSAAVSSPFETSIKRLYFTSFILGRGCEAVQREATRRMPRTLKMLKQDICIVSENEYFVLLHRAALHGYPLVMFSRFFSDMSISLKLFSSYLISLLHSLIVPREGENGSAVGGCACRWLCSISSFLVT